MPAPWPGWTRSGLAVTPSVEAALKAQPTDVYIDYTHPSAVKANVLTALELGVPAVVGTSGLHRGRLCARSPSSRSKQGLGVVASGNFSLTASLLHALLAAGGAACAGLRDHRLCQIHQARRAVRHRAGTGRAPGHDPAERAGRADRQDHRPARKRAAPMSAAAASMRCACRATCWRSKRSSARRASA